MFIARKKRQSELVKNESQRKKTFEELGYRLDIGLDKIVSVETNEKYIPADDPTPQDRDLYRDLAGYYFTFYF